MDLATLSKLYTAEGPFVTIYLPTESADENAAEMLETRWKNVLRELDDVVVRAAIGTGAEIRFVAGDVEQAPREGIGALLRFTTDPATTA